MTPGQQIDLKPEALLQFQTAAPLDVPIPSQNGQQPSVQRASYGSLQTRNENAFIDLPNQADPGSFDIVSLRLAMTAREADDALTTRFPTMQKGSPMASDAAFTPGRKYISAVSRGTAQFNVFLQFLETYPFDPARPEQLTSITYTPVTQTDADRQQFRQSVLAKYGQPYRELNGLSAVWCDRGISLGSGPLACAPNVPTLQLKGTELRLSDSGPLTRERAAWNRRTTSDGPPL